MLDWKRSGPVTEVVVIAAVVAGLMITAAARGCGEELSRSVPRDVPDPNGWPVRPADESITSGTFRLANTTVTFMLSVEPGYAGIYRVSRYRTCDHGAQACDPETLLWLRPTKPGGHGVIAAIYYRFQRRTVKKLWLGRERYWHQLPRGSPEYRMEARRAGNLFVLLGDIQHGADPASLTF